MASNQTKHKAMVANTKSALEQQETDIPKPGKGQVLVKISHVAQNPTDVQSFDSAAMGDGAVYGCDFVGEVIELGPDASRHNIGDVIAGLIWGGEIKGLGAYSQHTVADERISFKLPPGADRAAASTVPLAAATAWLALFSKDCLSIDRSTPQTVLIWGGSSSVGQYAIQLASLFSFKIITTCSPKNFNLVRSLGASHVFDYNDPDIVQKIQNVAPELKYVFDTIGNKSSSATACEAASAQGTTMVTVRPGKGNTEDVSKSVKVTDVLVWTAFLKDHAFGEFKWPASREDHELSAELFEKLPRWIADGKVKTNAVLPLKGLESVPEGFEMYRKGAYSAQKIVYQL